MRSHSLAFFVAAILSFGSAEVAASEWRATENVDRFTDETTHSIYLQGILAVGLFDLSCDEGGEMRAIFHWFAPVNGFYGSDVQVEWRLGSRPRGILRGRPSPTRDAVWNAESVELLIDDLLEGEPDSTSLIVRSSGNLLEFDITGFRGAYEKLAARCKS